MLQLGKPEPEEKSEKTEPLVLVALAIEIRQCTERSIQSNDIYTSMLERLEL